MQCLQKRCWACLHWAHKKCNVVIGRLKLNPDYRCSKLKVAAPTINGRTYNDWSFVQDKKMGLIYSFSFLEDKFGAGGVCDLSVITRVRSAWGKFQELMPVLTSYTTCGQIYSICIQLVLLYVSKFGNTVPTTSYSPWYQQHTNIVKI